MREIFELINKYPWTTICITIVLLIILNGLLTFMIHVINILKK